MNLFTPFLSVLLLLPSFASGAQSESILQAHTALRTRQYDQALAILRPQANGGDAEAQYLLGTLYLNGLGIQKSHINAFQLFQQAAAQNHVKASYELGLMFENGRGITQDLDQARHLYEAAAQQGHSRAKKRLSELKANNKVASASPEELLNAISRNQVDRLRQLLEHFTGDLNANAPRLDGNTLLTFAIEKDSNDAVDLLLQYGAHADTPNASQQSPLQLSIIHDDLATTHSLLNAGANINAKDSLGDSPLHVAVRLDRYDGIQLLLERKATVNIANKSGDFPLDLAKTKQTQTRQLLLNYGATENPERQGKRSDQASSKMLTKNAKSFFEGSADPNNPLNDWPALNIAAWRGNTQLLASLLSDKQPVDSIDSGGLTPLLRAACKGHSSIVAMLLKAGAQAAFRSQNGLTAVLCASQGGHINVVDKLTDEISTDLGQVQNYGQAIEASIENNDDTMAQSIFYQLPPKHRKPIASKLLLKAAQRGISELVQDFLLAEASPDSTDMRGISALWWATFNGHTDSVKLLLDEGANPNNADLDGNTPLMIASRKANTQLVTWLLERDADVQASNHIGNTALIFAAQGNAPEIIKLLVLHKADVKVRNKLSETALMQAAQFNSLAAFKVLALSGAKPARRNKDGKDAWEIARAAGSTDIVAYRDQLER